MVKPQIEVCLSPWLLPFSGNLKESVVVIIDVLRATSTIATALYNGAASIIPVDSVEECIRIGKEENAITAGERGGEVAPGLSHGNSPFEYPKELVEDQTIVLTTTNGTSLINKSRGARQIITGSFPNISAVCMYLIQQPHPVILACAGWRGRVNIEDTFFAGAVINRIAAEFDVTGDSSMLAENLFLQYKDNVMELIRQSSHFDRLTRLGLLNDVEYCLTSDVAPSLPILQEDRLINKL